MRLFEAALDAPLDSPFSATLSVHGLHFTVCAPSKKGAVLTKTSKKMNLLLTSKTRAFLHKPREGDKMTKMAGVKRTKAWFTKGMVFVPWLGNFNLAWQFQSWPSEDPQNRKQADYCFESTVWEERTHWVLRQTRWVLPETRWVRFGAQIVGREELTELSSRNSARAKKLTELDVWNRALRNRIRPVSDEKKALVGGSLEIFTLTWKFRSLREVLITLCDLWALKVEHHHAVGLHLNPVTINPVIRMSCLGPFSVRGIPSFCPSNSELRACNPCFEAQNGRPRKHPGTTPGRSNSPKIDIRPTGFNMTGFRCPGAVGQKRQIDVAGQKLPRDNFCLSLVSQLTSPRG